MSLTGEIVRASMPHSELDPEVRRACLQACIECARVCSVCADACLREDQVRDLRRCIALDLACASVCEATASLLGQAAIFEPELLRAQLQACVQASNLCATECEAHAGMHEHCRICKEACRRCEDLCRETVGQLIGAATP